MPAAPAPPAAPSAIPAARMPAPPSAPPPADGAAPSSGSPFKPDTIDRTKPARDQFHQRLQRDAKPAAEPPPAPNDRQMPPDPADSPPTDETPEQKAEREAKAADVPRGTTDQKPLDKPVDKRKNPWKLYEEEKKARAATETELQRLKSERIPEQDRTALTERAAKAEKRLAELENEIEFVSFQKSAKFQKEYEEPYVKAWNRAVKELSEITVADAAAPNGQRDVIPDDIWTLVNLPLGQAQEIADEAFGKFAGVAMRHREQIKELLEKRNEAVEEAKTKGGERTKQQQEAFQAQTKQAVSDITTLYKAVTDEIMNDPASSEFLKPFVAEEGKELPEDQKEWNEFLEKGYKLVDDGWSQNPLRPGLKPEERKKIVQMHAAIRNRAAAFGPLKRAHKRALKTISELQKKLDAYKGTAPSAGGRNGAPLPSARDDARSAFHSRLEKLVRR
jgi:hypothetical protein